MAGETDLDGAGARQFPAPADVREWDERSELAPLAAVLDPADRDGRKNAHIHRIHSLALRRLTRFRGDEHVIDFGCGNGRVSAVIAPMVHRVSGVDVSEKMIESARRRCPDERCEFHLYDGRRLPFEDEYLDAAVSAVTLQLFCSEPDRFRAIAGELVRTLRPGARLWLIERMVPAETETEWPAERWRAELEACGAAVDRIRPVRTGALTKTGLRVMEGRVPGWLQGPAAWLDYARTVRGGIEPPYTECMIEAHRGA